MAATTSMPHRTLFAPLVVVRVNTQTGAITGIETPPPHVLWGDISTLLF
jgi:hypothetical protein